MTHLTPLIKLDALSVCLQQRWVLKDISLQLTAGEIVTLIGPNGAGKTTLVRLLLGLMLPTSGKVLRQPGLSIGYMPQRIKIEATMPLQVQRFVGLAGSYKSPQIAEVLRYVGAEKLAQSFMQHLSGGEMQRVLLARALIRKPKLLVLDEPVQAIDAIGQIELYDLIEKIRKETHCGVLLVSHDLHLVMAKTDRVICLDHRICCQGSPEDVSQSASFQKLFSAVQQNSAVYRHHHHHERNFLG